MTTNRLVVPERFLLVYQHGPGTRSWNAEPARARHALASHHARHDLRRGGGGRHAFNRRRARQKVMALIEQMGVHNMIVEAKETVEWQAHQKVRKLSPALRFRIIE